MATDNSGVHTLLDVAKIHNGKEMLPVVENLTRKNGIVKTALWEEANGLTSHVFPREEALPSGTWRGVGEGTSPGKAQIGQEVENLSRIEGRSQIDTMLINDIVPNPKEYRMQWDNMHGEGLGQDLVKGLFYGNFQEVKPNKPKGFSARYNSLANYTENLHSAGSANDGAVMSIYMIQWGRMKCTFLYGRDQAAKIIQREDMGKVFVYTDVATNKGYWAYETLFHAVVGICVYDDRAVQRLCNIGTDGKNEPDIDQLIWMHDSLPDPEMGDTYIFCNRLAKNAIKKAVRNRPNVMWTEKDQYGRMRDVFYGLPMYLTEGLTTTEKVVS